MPILKSQFLGLPLIVSISLLIAFIPRLLNQPPAHAQTLTGTIAYIRPGGQEADEIWLIEPDGSNNRRIWTVGQADPDNISEVSDIDWRPDAGELAFTSDHQFRCSLYQSDIYAIWPDGSGYRRITNSPDCASLASYAKGAVSVTVRNFTTCNPLYVYIQGAPQEQSVLVSQGDTATVTFTDVADFGDGVAQQAVVIWGDGRWFSPAAVADVKPGQTVQTGSIDVSGASIEDSGAYVPSWHSDGSRLGFIFDAGAAMAQIPANPAPNQSGTYLLNTQNVLAIVMDWGPIPAKADQLLYWIRVKDGVGDGGIYQVTEGSDTRGTELVDTGIEGVIDIQWLPDGSGFLYTKDGNFRNNANIHRYEFATSTTTQLTQFTNEFTIDISVSPDGEWIVFERAANLALTSGDLWIMRRDGPEMRRLVQNGLRPSWSSQAPLLPQKGYLPLVQR